LNITPDSFSDGGRFLDAGAALDHALRMLDEGADVIDLGGESTRPNAVALTAGQEQARVLPVLRAILAARPGTVLSIDTYHAETARAAVDAGAEIVNDVSGHLWDGTMSAACAELRCGAILMHTRGRPQEWKTQGGLAPEEVVPLVIDELRARTEAAMRAGVARETIVVDPGFGFGKILDENYPLLARLGELHALGFPVMAGVSRKSFLRGAAADAAGRTPVTSAPGAGGAAELGLATAVANTAAILGGAHILRVHDVAAARDVAYVADRVLQVGGG
ncbi:MAG TPA: dihydropteroate synthase, partial [Acidobacteriaceae bacterium]|nr:dihydropteroate synthase [Acidobacteriaceae bacterium]